jgi:hypothetical protein
VRAERFVVCHNPEQAERDAAVRGRLIAHLAEPNRGASGKAQLVAPSALAAGLT